MTLPQLYDVAIIGAGPAGSSLALHLSRAGLRVLLFDQAVFPRKKVCAGGLTARALKLLPREMEPVIENRIFQVILSHKLERQFTRSYPRPLLYTVDRSRFDRFLAEKAEQFGAFFRPGEKVAELISAGGSFSLVSPTGRDRARVVVGADGVRSRVAAGAGLRPVDCWHLGLQAEVPAACLKSSLDFCQAILIDWGSIPHGYGWVFPRGATLAVGVAGPLPLGRQVKSYQARLLAHLGLDPARVELQAHLIPHRLGRKAIAGENLLLVGDAAGLADYWTGEGIFYALKSSRIAARQIERFFHGQPRAWRDYEAEVNETITPELRASHTFARIFNYLAPLAFAIIKEYDYPWDVFCRLMRGDRTFEELRQRFRPDIFWRKLFNPASRNR
jgi:geranylgeranyl reductase family protein